MRSTFCRYFNHTFCSAANAVANSTAAQHYLYRWQYTGTCFKRAAMKTYMRQAMLAAAVHTAADFYLDIAVYIKFFVFVVDQVFKHFSHGHAVADTQVTGIGTGAGSNIGNAIKTRRSKIKGVKAFVQCRQGFFFYIL
jgi:hypothetical protein